MLQILERFHNMFQLSALTSVVFAVPVWSILITTEEMGTNSKVPNLSKLTSYTQNNM